MKPYFYLYNATIGEFTGEKFDTAARAVEMSLELAESNPGEAFEILRCVGYSSTSKASTFWMDGEEPPEKPLYRMLEDGEIIMGEDEFQHPEGWRKHHGSYNAIGETFRKSNHLPHRRPL